MRRRQVSVRLSAPIIIGAIQNPPEVLVLGGGPAGSSAARLLAAWGHSVRLVTRAPAQSRLAVSLPPSCAKLFDAIGVTAAIERAGFIRSTGNTVWWGSREPRVEMFAGGARGWQVETSVLEGVMLDEAARAGAAIEIAPGASADKHDPPRHSFVLDCTGRAGVLARVKGLRRYDDGPRTIALVASWRRDQPWPVPDDTHTLVESYETGWAWSVPSVGLRAPGSGLRSVPAAGGGISGARHVAVMIDPQRSGLARGGSPRDVYLAEIAKTAVFRELTAGASFDDGPWGWDASTYRSDRYAGDGWLLVGDAGSFIDPLSSAGVKKALASGWLAAIVTHTCLGRPALKQHALDFFSTREIEVEATHEKTSRRFLAAAAPSHRHRFWSERADESAAGVEDPGVGDAFDRLRRAPLLHARANPAVRIEARPAIDGRDIVLEQRIVDAGYPAGIRHARGVDLLLLLELAPLHRQVPDLFEAYLRRSSGAALPDFLYALATAVARRWLVVE